jgi:hypothetical protein
MGQAREGRETRITGTTMANDVDIPKPDRAENRATYESFTGITRNALIAIVVALALMALFLL